MSYRPRTNESWTTILVALGAPQNTGHVSVTWCCHEFCVRADSQLSATEHCEHSYCDASHYYYDDCDDTRFDQSYIADFCAKWRPASPSQATECSSDVGHRTIGSWSLTHLPAVLFYQQNTIQHPGLQQQHTIPPGKLLAATSDRGIISNSQNRSYYKGVITSSASRPRKPDPI